MILCGGDLDADPEIPPDASRMLQAPTALAMTSSLAAAACSATTLSTPPTGSTQPPWTTLRWEVAPRPCREAATGKLRV